MKHSIRLFASAALSLCAASALAADIKVGVVTSLSGPGSSIGIPYQKGVQAGQAFRPSVNGRNVQLVILDDGSDPTAAARNARKLIEEEKVDVLIAAATLPALIATVQVGREEKTPTIGLTPIAPSPLDIPWLVTVAQPPQLMIDAVVERMKRNGVKTVAFIGFSDATGDIFYNALTKAAEPAQIGVVGNERYARNDLSVTGQVLKVMALHPDAVMGGGSGTPGALPYMTLADRGYRGPIYGSHALINPDFVRVGGAAVEGLIASTGPVVVAEQLPDDYPTKARALEYRAVYEKLYGAPPADAFSAYSFDAWLVFADAAGRIGDKAEPGTPQYREAMRDAVKSTTNLVGTHGVYNFTRDQVYGDDERARVIVRLEKGAWKWVP